MITPPNAFSAALATAKNKRRRRLWVVAAIISAVLVLAGVVIWMLWFSSLWTVTKVEVTGTSLLDPDEVIAAAGISQDTPVAAVDVAAVSERVEALPPVAAVEVSRAFPDAVHVVIEEREAVFARQADSGYSWVDAEGVAFHTTEEAPSGVPIATQGRDEPRLLRDIATVVGSLPDALDDQGIVIANPAVDRIVLMLPGERAVVWGSADDSALKAEVLSALLSVEASVYDVSAPMHPTTS